MQAKPLLLVDVDGVISLWGWRSDTRPAGRYLTVDGLPHFLSATAGAHLLDLAEDFELAWCTGWEDRANDHLPHVLGLPGTLPTITFDRAPGARHAHWKLGGIDAFAGPERPLAWIDDAHDEHCRTWAAERPGPTLLVATTPDRGLTAEHVERLRAFARDWTSRDP